MYYNFNGKYFVETENNISINNRSFRYGDGFFETIKLVDGVIQLKDLHLERIAKSLTALKFKLPTHFSFKKLEQQIIELAIKNNHQSCARIRINFCRGNGGLYDAEDNVVHIFIQSFALQNKKYQLNQNGLCIDVYDLAKKSCDEFSNIKSNNFLPYTMAALWAKENKLNDALLLNCNNNIADSTIANIFIITKNGIIRTSALNQGCIDGVMRKYVIQQLAKNNILVEEAVITVKDIEQAEAIFLTNAIKGISWVKCFRDKSFEPVKVDKLFNAIFNKI